MNVSSAECLCKHEQHLLLLHSKGLSVIKAYIPARMSLHSKGLSVMKAYIPARMSLLTSVK